MNGTIQKWENSHAVRLPKPILEAAMLHENDAVILSAEEDRIVITKAQGAHVPLRERIARAEGGAWAEWDTGAPQGNEAL